MSRGGVAGSESGKGLTKWQLALLVGVPLAAVAIGGAAIALYLRRRRQAGARGTSEAEPGIPDAAEPQVGDQPGKKKGDASKTDSGDSSETRVPTQPRTQSALEQARAVKLRGNDLYKQQKYNEAIKAYEEAIELCPASETEDLAVFHQNLAAVYDALVVRTPDEDRKSSHIHAVVDNCTKALENNPRYVKALTRRTKAYDAVGRKSDALLDATRALLLDETTSQALAPIVARLLKEIGRELSSKNFSKLGPLAPTKHLVSTYFDSFTWRDDLTVSGLKRLWLAAKSKATVATTNGETQDPIDQSASKDESHDQQEADQLEPEAETEPPKAMSPETEPPEAESPEVEPPQVEPPQAEPPEVEPPQVELPEAESPEVEPPQVEPPQAEPPDPFEGFSEQPFVRAASLFLQKKYNGIRELLTEAVENGHAVFVPHAMLLRGAMHTLWREDDKALKDFQDVINAQGLSPEMYVNALLKKAGIFAGQYEVEKSKTCFEKAVAIDPNNADIYVHRARVGLEAEDLQGLASVQNDLDKAIKLAPDSPYAYFSQASVFHRIAGVQQSMQLLETARIKFEAAIQRFPNYVDGLILYTMFLQDVGDFQKTEDVLRKAVRVQPDNPLGHFSLGLLNIVYKQDVEGGIAAMETAIAVDNSCVQAYDTLASMELHRGNTGRAMELYEQGIQAARTKAEMSQAYVAREVILAQEKACQEYGISPSELANKPLPSGV